MYGALRTLRLIHSTTSTTTLVSATSESVPFISCLAYNEPLKPLKWIYREIYKLNSGLTEKSFIPMRHVWCCIYELSCFPVWQTAAPAALCSGPGQLPRGRAAGAGVAGAGADRATAAASQRQSSPPAAGGRHHQRRGATLPRLHPERHQTQLHHRCVMAPGTAD